MASTIYVDKLDPQSGTALEIGTSGDTITVPSGATLTIAGTINASTGTATGFAMTGWSTGGTSNSFIPSATDQGIYLGVSSATAANLLDDYEEGTWTPAWAAGSGTLTGTSSNYGNYTKIGNMVSLWFGAIIDSGSASSYLKITNAPFTSATNGSGTGANSQSGLLQKAWWDSGGTTINMNRYDGTLETDPNLKMHIMMKV